MFFFWNYLIDALLYIHSELDGKILCTRDNHGLSAEDIAAYKKKKAEKKAWVSESESKEVAPCMLCCIVMCGVKDAVICFVKTLV